MPSLPAHLLDPRMVRTADALLSVGEALLGATWPGPGGDIAGFLRLADLSITSVEPDGGRVTTSDGLAGTCAVTGTHLSSITFTFDRLRPGQVKLGEVITDWFTAKFGAPYDSGETLPRSRRWRVGTANVVLDQTLSPQPRVTWEISRDEETTELGASARALVQAIRVFTGAPLPEHPDQLAAWLGEAAVRPIDGEPGQGLLVWTTRRLTGHWTGTGVPDEIYLTAHGEPDWLDELAHRVRRGVSEYLGAPSDESDDVGDGTRLHEWATEHAVAGVLRSPARGITGIYISRHEAEFATAVTG